MRKEISRSNYFLHGKCAKGIDPTERRTIHVLCHRCENDLACYYTNIYVQEGLDKLAALRKTNKREYDSVIKPSNIRKRIRERKIKQEIARCVLHNQHYGN